MAHDNLITKREILQDVSKIFDPLGFVSLVVIRAKILIQTLWKSKIAWDEPLNEKLHAEWKVITNDLKAASELSVTRCYFQSAITKPSIHCFADASLRAYGAVVFIVQEDQVSFVMAKTSPLKLLTLPRLELMATLIATRLIHFILDTLALQDPPVYIWSDSQIVLHWVQSDKKLPAFVSHRVNEMKSQLPAARWRYCPTLENPADLLISTSPNTPQVLLVRQLRLFLDTKEYLRCGGRIHNAPLNETTRFPYLLPSKHPLSRLIILDIHVSLCHSGTGATLTAVRQTYWIPSARQYIKSLLRKCVTCLKITGKPFPAPDPAPLPQSRMQDVHPFTYTGVDFTVALYVKDGSQEARVYLCLFICATTRAVHLEIVQDLTAETFLLAFRKFAGRRSLPRMMISDNGSTYLSAAEELKSLMELPGTKQKGRHLEIHP